LSWESHEREESRLGKNVIATPVGAVLMRHLTAARVEDHLHHLDKRGAVPASVNHVRAKLRTIFFQSEEGGHLLGPNPITETRPRRVPKRVQPTLRTEEIPLVLEQVPDDWRAFTTTAIYAGLRKGELCGPLALDGLRATPSPASRPKNPAALLTVCRRPKQRRFLLRSTPGISLRERRLQSEPPGDRTQDPRFKRPGRLVARGGRDSQALATTGQVDGEDSIGHQDLAGVPLWFADRLLTVREVAAFLRVSTRTVYTLLRPGPPGARPSDERHPREAGRSHCPYALKSQVSRETRGVPRSPRPHALRRRESADRP
jgi:hypothetical protein